MIGNICFKVDGKRLPETMEIYILYYAKDDKLIVCADHMDTFDKFRKCPIQLPLPESDEQSEYLYKMLEYFNTEEGIEISNECEYDKFIYEYPENIRL